MSEELDVTQEREAREARARLQEALEAAIGDYDGGVGVKAAATYQTAVDAHRVTEGNI